MVFQSFALFPWLTVLQNVELGLEALGIESTTRRRRALAAIDLIGLDGFESAYPKELSGGMRKRLGFARCLVRAPRLLLLDEPFASLDVALKADMYGLLQELIAIQGTSVILVSHDLHEALLLGDEIYVLRNQPAAITQRFTNPFSHPRGEELVQSPFYAQTHKMVTHILRQTV